MSKASLDLFLLLLVFLCGFLMCKVAGVPLVLVDCMPSNLFGLIFLLQLAFPAFPYDDM